MKGVSTQGQEAIEPLLEGVDLIVLDNLATLARHGRSNDEESWLPVQGWLLGLRRRGVSAFLIPHQGKDASNDVIRRIAAKYDLEVTEKPSEDYCEPVDFNGEAYKFCEGVAHEVFPGLPTVPYVMTGGTDARYYQEICDACVRFAPIVYGPAQMKGMHGLNENLDCFSLPGGVDFYKTVVKRNK